MVGQERTPGLARRALGSTPAVTPNGAVADHDAQLEQLVSDPLRTPERVLAGHGHDELSHLAFDKPVWPTSMLRYGPPVWGLSMFTRAGSATGVWSRSSLL
jgi:hypothetical protein